MEVSFTVNELWVLWAHMALMGFVRRFLWGGFVLFAVQISWALEASWNNNDMKSVSCVKQPWLLLVLLRGSL